MLTKYCAYVTTFKVVTQKIFSENNTCEKIKQLSRHKLSLFAGL
jgi:hypothetical protein